MERFDSILWMQHENPSNNGCLVVNNRFIPNPDDNFYHLVNRKLLKVFSLSIFDEAIVNKYKTNSANQDLHLGSGLFKGVAYRSCFFEKNEKGNWEPFMFWNSSFHLKDFVKNINASASAMGKTLDAKELKFVEKYIRKIRNRRIVSCILGAALVILILIIVIVKLHQ